MRQHPVEVDACSRDRVEQRALEVRLELLTRYHALLRVQPQVHKVVVRARDEAGKLAERVEHAAAERDAVVQQRREVWELLRGPRRLAVQHRDLIVDVQYRRAVFLHPLRQTRQILVQPPRVKAKGAHDEHGGPVPHDEVLQRVQVILLLLRDNQVHAALARTRVALAQVLEADRVAHVAEARQHRTHCRAQHHVLGSVVLEPADREHALRHLAHAARVVVVIALVVLVTVRRLRLVRRATAAAPRRPLLLLCGLRPRGPQRQHRVGRGRVRRDHQVPLEPLLALPRNVLARLALEARAQLALEHRREVAVERSLDGQRALGVPRRRDVARAAAGDALAQLAEDARVAGRDRRQADRQQAVALGLEQAQEERALNFAHRLGRDVLDVRVLVEPVDLLAPLGRRPHGHRRGQPQAVAQPLADLRVVGDLDREQLTGGNDDVARLAELGRHVRLGQHLGQQLRVLRVVVAVPLLEALAKLLGRDTEFLGKGDDVGLLARDAVHRVLLQRRAPFGRGDVNGVVVARVFGLGIRLGALELLLKVRVVRHGLRCGELAVLVRDLALARGDHAPLGVELKHLPQLV
eukprot:Unigene6224_Nuclearia_a/m.19166 Unigene6224_Nuclearia_a/g.19166  ORF Unigene6224_Nuclearia_a/g.19166 Unigene6224_Nuclearia_a/m.19166 type:complete len:580 (-) Unigene6224_Nuclearia_a:546-2285(-)